MNAQCALQQDRIARSGPRAQLFLSATIQFDRVTAAVRLRDLSVSGARIEGSALPQIGKTAHISRGSLQTIGTIVWRAGKAGGVRFDEPLELDEWLPAQAARDQQIVDDMIEDVRSGDPQLPPDVPEWAIDERPRDLLPIRLAEELAYVSRLLERLGEELCVDPLLVMRHADKLQTLDIATQILGHVGALLVAERPEQAIGAIGMTDLRKRLQRVSL